MVMKEEESLFPEANEPLADYLVSDRYKKYTRSIHFTSIEKQEEANHLFWRHLTPKQRLELHQMMLADIYGEDVEGDRPKEPIELVFTEPSL